MNSNILKAVPLFSSMNEEQLNLLQPCLQQRSYPRGSFILREGEQTDALLAEIGLDAAALRTAGVVR